MPEKLTILGSGVGYPDIERGKELRYPPGHILEKNGLKILFDCSPGTEFRLAQAGIDYANVKTVAITHFHPDHFGGLVNFTFFSRVRALFEQKLPTQMKLHRLTPVVSSPVGSMEQNPQKRKFLRIHPPSFQLVGFLRRRINLIGPVGLENRFNTIKSAYWEKDVDPFNGMEIVFSELKGDGSGVELQNGARLKGFSIFHESQSVPALALRAEFEDGFVFAYSGDSGACEGLKNAAHHADIFLCEASADINEDKSGYGHMSLFDAGKLASEAGVKKLILTHYSGNNSETEMVAEAKRSGFKGDISLAKDFQQIHLP